MDTFFSGVRISSIHSVVPENVINNISLPFESKTIKKIIGMTGVEERHVLKDDESLLLYYELLAKQAFCHIDPETVDVVIVVSQTPEYRLPTTANLLHGILGLKKEAMAFDVNQGCSGFIYGLHVANSLLSVDSDIKRVFLFVGDAINKVVNSNNKSTAFLFGDAATLTVLDRDETASDSFFVLRSNGTGAKNIIIKDGGISHPFCESSHVEYVGSDGNVSTDATLYMNGGEVFEFTMDEVPSIVSDVISFSNLSKDDIDVYCLHQANKFMLEYLANKIGISDKTPINIEKFGNTSSASIPLLITTEPDKCLMKNSLLVGFGVGFSIGAAILDLSETKVSFVIGLK